METQQTLFPQRSISRVAPKPNDTRAQAYEKVKVTAKTLRVRLIKDFAEKSFTADEWATKHKMSVLSVRPRVSECNRAGLLHRVVGERFAP
jgi:hypothetical protein